ncbi:hypothetical protein V6073_22435, partial [Klebsiella pneumoniae]
MHLSSKLRKIENENQLSFRFFFEDEGIKEKVYIPVESNSIVEDHGNKVPNHDYQELGNDSNLLIVFYVQIMPDDFVMQLHR